MWKMSVRIVDLQKQNRQSRYIGVLEDLALGSAHPGLATEEDNFTASIVSDKDVPASVQVHDDAMRSSKALENELHL